MKHQAYTAALSRMMQGTATAADRSNVEQYENDHPAKNCLHCGRNTRTMLSPHRVAHAEDECTTETKLKRK